MNETTNAASTQPDRRGADLLTAIDELKEAAGTLAFKLGETEHAEYAFQLAQGLFEVWQELWGAAHPELDDEQSDDDNDDTVTLTVRRNTLLYLFAGGNYSPTAKGPHKKGLTEALALNVVDHAAWLATISGESEERGRAHYAACQIEAALELIDALRKGGVQ